MYCIAQKKTGEPCTRLVNGTTQWCEQHVKKMLKYYNTYKSIESTIECLQDDKFEINTCSQEQAINMLNKLLKAYHYRTTLRKFVYPDYRDEGHAYLIEKIVKLISQLSQHINHLESIKPTLRTFEDLDVEQQPRPAQPTSHRKMKIQKNQIKHDIKPSKNYTTVENMYVFAHTAEICYLEALFSIIDHYFIDKFGTEDGPVVRNVALHCAYSIAITAHERSKVARNKLAESKARIKNSHLPEDPNLLPVYTTYIKRKVELFDFVKESLHRVKNNRLAKKIILFYTAYIVIHSFRINIGSILKHLHETMVIPSWIVDINYLDQRSILTLRTIYSEAPRDEVMLCFEKFPEALNTQVFLKDLKQRNVFRELPQLDIIFCITMGKIYKLNNFICKAEDNILTFYTPFVKSQSVDLALLSPFIEFQHEVKINKVTYSEYIKTLHPTMTDFEINVGSFLSACNNTSIYCLMVEPVDISVSEQEEEIQSFLTSIPDAE